MLFSGDNEILYSLIKYLILC